MSLNPCPDEEGIKTHMNLPLDAWLADAMAYFEGKTW